MPPPANSYSPFPFSSKLTRVATLTRIGMNYGVDCRLPEVRKIDPQLALGAVWAVLSHLTITFSSPQPGHNCDGISSRKYRDSDLQAPGGACPKPRLSASAVI